MIISITYGDEKYKCAKRFNCKMAKRHGADKVILYGPEDIDEEFKEKNSRIWNQSRGGGYWLWKPYIIQKNLLKMNPEDYLVYTDAGAAFIRPIRHLIQAMDKVGTDVMVFSLCHMEKEYTKRDAFVLMDCDSIRYTDTFQTLGGYIILKRTERSERLVAEWLKYAQDERIVTDIPNQMGLPNYEGFVENRHDQTILSLLCKKYGIKPFRDPSQFGIDEALFPKDVQERSPYPQVIDSFRDGSMKSVFQLKYRNKKWFKYTRWSFYRDRLLGIKRHVRKIFGI